LDQLKPAPLSPEKLAVELEFARRLRQLLYLLVLVLVFEGLVRKAFPRFGMELFFVKDAVVAIMAFYVVRMSQPPALAFFFNAYRALVILLAPLIFMTAWFDPLLAIFGAKQYLLYPVVGFATFLGFHREERETTMRFFRLIALLIIPTALLSIVQLRLPTDNWLNESVRGDSLVGFSAAGHLRVSSTFSFVAQYCAFLNVESFAIMIALHRWRERAFYGKLLFLSLIPLLVLSSFLTGSRGAVMGNTTVIFLAGILALMSFRTSDAIRIGGFILLLCLVALAVNHFSPSATAAYIARDEGQLFGISSDIRGRVLGSFTAPFQDPSLMTLFGHGLGMMSNGATYFSPYAASWRLLMWTESDFSTVFFEGGWYLAVVWYGFRVFMIGTTLARFRARGEDGLFIPAAFIQAFVIMVGILGTIGAQPPTAIWWWLSIGGSLLFWWHSLWSEGTQAKLQEPEIPVLKRKVRGRSLYAEALHSRRRR
jgi:hypothetical protein